MSGTLEYDDFVKSCQYFVESSKDLCPGWQLKSSKFDKSIKYLEKKCVTLRPNIPISKEDEAENIIDFTVQDTEENDDSCVKVVCSDVGQTKFEYHIIYNISYSVPVLYFTAMTKDGKSLKLAEIWQGVPAVYGDALAEKWSFVTQTEHPLLGYPVFHIHPCNTAQLMDQLLWSTEGHSIELRRYVPVWLSAVGPLVGLQLAPDMFVEKTCLNAE